MGLVAIITLDGAMKLLFIALLSPLWWPVARTLWNDAQDALREEGGLFGRTPSPRELARLRKERGDYQTPLLNVPFEDQRGQRRPPR